MTTTIALTGQLEPVRPLAVKSWFMRSGEGDLAALKAISDLWSVPTWVRVGGGTIASQRANLSDDQVEQCIRDWIYSNVNYTGTVDVGGTAAPVTARALDVYNWIQTNIALHAGLGPTIDCGNIMNMYVGFLAAYGIPGRVVWMHNGTTHAVDVSAEYWSPSVPGWVHTGPHLNFRDKWAATSIGASLLDAVTVARQTGSRVGIVNQTYEGASTGAASKSGVTEDLTSYNDWVVWGRGNRRQFATGAAGDPYLTDQGTFTNPYVSFLDPGAGAWATQVTAQKAFTCLARDITDIAFTPNALMATARLTSQGLVQVALDAVTIDTGYTYQVLPPGGAWTALPTSGHAFYPVGTAWQYRALGPLGNVTNTVTVTA